MDLEAATAALRQADPDAPGIPYADGAGRVFDFHVLRDQFISNLAAAGVHPKVAQALARHSTITLTMNRYTHLGLHDEAAPDLTRIVSAWPDLPAHVKAAVLALVGTAPPALSTRRPSSPGGRDVVE